MLRVPECVLFFGVQCLPAKLYSSFKSWNMFKQAVKYFDLWTFLANANELIQDLKSTYTCPKSCLEIKYIYVCVYIYNLSSSPFLQIFMIQICAKWYKRILDWNCLSLRAKLAAFYTLEQEWLLDLESNHKQGSKESTVMAYPGGWWSHHPWMCLKNAWMWHSVPWISWGVGTWVGHNALEGLFQPSHSVNSVKMLRALLWLRKVYIPVKKKNFRKPSNP